MIKKRATLVLGAGASYPYYFPLGRELKDKIIEQILEPEKDKQIQLQKLLIDLGHSEDELVEFAVKLRDSYFISVDAFLEEWSKYIVLGKRAITGNLITNEVRDMLMTQSKSVKKRKWYDYLLGLMGNRDGFLENNLSIITFNYDRSFEYFIYFTLKASFDMSETEIVNCVRRIPIIHVHGQLGYPHFINPDGRDYNNTLNVDVLDKYAKEISIIHENVSTQALSDAHRIIQESELLVFIGFGYHRKNVERLMLRENFEGEKIVCTFMGKQTGEKERDLEIMHTNTTTGKGKIPIDVYEGDALGFLKDTNYLK